MNSSFEIQNDRSLWLITLQSATSQSVAEIKYAESMHMTGVVC